MSRFAPTDAAVTLRWTSRYYRPANPAIVGYRDRATADAVLRDAVADIGPGGTAVSINGEPPIYVGFSHAKRDPNYHGHIPRILVRGDSGDIFVSIYDLD